MKTKNIIGGTVVVIGLGILVYYLKRRIRKGEPNVEIKPKKPKPQDLFKDVVIEELRGGKWNNERDFLANLTKEFIKRAENLEWLDYLPYCLDDLMERLDGIGLLGTFEKELEKRYVGWMD